MENKETNTSGKENNESYIKKGAMKRLSRLVYLTTYFILVLLLWISFSELDPEGSWTIINLSFASILTIFFVELPRGAYYYIVKDVSLNDTIKSGVAKKYLIFACVMFVFGLLVIFA